MVKNLVIDSNSQNEIDDFNLAINNHNDFIVVAVHMPGCGWCKKLEDEWKLIQKEKMENVLLAWVHMDALQSLDFVKDNMIDGYPFVVGYKNKKKINFEKERTKEEIVNWIRENNSQTSGGKRKRRGGHMEMILLPALGAAGYLNYRQSKSRKTKRKSRKTKKSKSKTKRKNKRTTRRRRK
jgi:hypothetical protein